MTGRTSGSKSKNILSSLVELLLFSGIEYPIAEVEFETHHTQGPGTKVLGDTRVHRDIAAEFWLLSGQRSASSYLYL